ncbi:winged helix-turn-helix transcriptional regulator, partial [Actinobacillus porcinus]
YNTVPPHVEYSLTDYGKEAGSRLANLVDWLEENLGKILQSRGK